MIEWAIARDDVRGIYNAVSPEPVRNRDFTRELGRALHRPAIIPIPAFALKLMFGEMATGTVLPSQRVMPARAMAEGFTFEQPQLAQALAHSLTRP
jgi:NAD dependent epimerase/dehydratase family enzyme